MQANSFQRHESRYFYALLALGALVVFLGYLAMHNEQQKALVQTAFGDFA